MTDYDSDSQLIRVAQSCKRFRSGGLGTEEDGISCGTCRNWDGSSCSANAFDNILTSLD